LIEQIVDATDEYIVMSDVVKQELEGVIISELYHRIDEIIVLAFLGDTALPDILSIKLLSVPKRKEC